MQNAPLKFLPNIRFEKAEATAGFTWGKPARISNILQKLPSNLRAELPIAENDIVAERWMCTDDRGNPSMVEGENQPFFELLEKHGEEILGPKHIAKYGPFLNVIMKQLDTHPVPNKGSLSVQLHPKIDHPTRPPKPEMWKGTGKTYFGWTQEMTPEQVRAVVADGTVEKYLNEVEMTPDKLIVVSGGIVHAIRYDTFTAEWSKAPGRDEIAKGNIKDASLALYDRTDGKTPRPGKEDIEGSLEVMTHADTFHQIDLKQAIHQLKIVTEDQAGNQVRELFRTPEVWVDEYFVKTNLGLDSSERGLPLYVEQGSIELIHEGEVIDTLHAGEERFIPFALQKLEMRNVSTTPATVQTWYAPF